MKYIYIITITLLLLSCGKQVEQPVLVDTGAIDEQTESGSEDQVVNEDQTEDINTMVGEESLTGGGYGVPESANGDR